MYNSEFDTSFRRERFVLWIYCRKLSKNKFPQLLLTLPKTFHPIAQKKLTGHCDGHWISWRCNSERFQVTLGREKVFWPRYSSDVEQFFSFCFALSDDLSWYPSPGKMLQKLVYYYLSASSNYPSDLKNETEIFLLTYLRISIKKTRPFG